MTRAPHGLVSRATRSANAGVLGAKRQQEKCRHQAVPAAAELQNGNLQSLEGKGGQRG